LPWRLYLDDLGADLGAVDRDADVVVERLGMIPGVKGRAIATGKVKLSTSLLPRGMGVITRSVTVVAVAEGVTVAVTAGEAVVVGVMVAVAVSKGASAGVDAVVGVMVTAAVGRGASAAVNVTVGEGVGVAVVTGVAVAGSVVGRGGVGNGVGIGLDGGMTASNRPPMTMLTTTKRPTTLKIV